MAIKAHKVELDDVPPGGVIRSIRLLIEVEPATGAAMIYGDLNTQPRRANGPKSTLEIPATDPVIYVQPVDGAKSFRLAVLSHTEDTGRSMKLTQMTWHQGSGPGEDVTIDIA